MSGLELKKIFPEAFDSRVGELQSQMIALQNIFLQMGEKEIKLRTANDDLIASRKLLEQLQ
jgi:hypothetical protein